MRMIWLIRLYPASWRERYGGELEQLVHDVRPSTSTVALAVDLIKGALDAHVQQRFGMRTANLRAIRRGALIATIVWLGLTVEIVLSNVVFPTKGDDDAIPVVISYLCDGLIGAAVFLTVALGASGVGLSLIGGLIGREPQSPASMTTVDRPRS
jgi:hypothetical protein